MTVFVSDTFTGANGAAWNVTNWTAGTNTSGTTSTIQSNAGHMDCGTASAYAGKCVNVINYTSPTDGEILLDFKFPSAGNTDCYIGGILRGDSIADNKNGYAWLFHRTNTVLKIEKLVNYASTTLTNTAFTVADDTWYSVRFNVTGTSLKARIWQTSNSEPASWTLTTTDSTFTTAGKTYITLFGGNASHGKVDVDNFVFSDGINIVAVSASETVTSSDGSGTLLAQVSAAETSTSADVLSAQARQAAETVTGTELGSINATPVFATEVIQGTDAFTALTATITDTDSPTITEAASVSVPPVSITDFEFCSTFDLVRRVGTGPYVFTLPWVEGERADDALFRRVQVRRQVSLLRIGGIFQLIVDPTIEQLNAADKIYLGGYEHLVTDDEAQDLGDAGWADFIEGFAFIPDAFYGAGQYGASFYGN